DGVFNFRGFHFSLLPIWFWNNIWQWLGTALTGCLVVVCIHFAFAAALSAFAPARFAFVAAFIAGAAGGGVAVFGATDCSAA
ncbi:MAG TPA: hypothetical protein PKH01_02915, partial [Pseudomonadales bacterium]|nr:hypothetical protein [Pseudomonadales bacterium]